MRSRSQDIMRGSDGPSSQTRQGASGDRALHREARARAAVRLTSFGAFVSGAVALVSVPIIITSIGRERFGMWAVASSLLLLASPLDLGIGNAVMTLLAQADAVSDNEGIQRLVRTSLSITTAVALVVLAASVAGLRFVDWMTVLGAQSAIARREASRVAQIAMISLAFGLPLNLIDKVHLGLQRGNRNGYIAVTAGAIQLASVMSVTVLHPTAPLYVLAIAAGPLLARAAAWILAPSILPAASIRFGVYTGLLRELFRASGLFAVLQVMSALSYHADQLIVASILSASSAAVYDVVSSMFMVVAVVQTLMLAPLWPAWAEAAASGDLDWVLKTFRSSMIRVVIVSAVLAAVITALGRPAASLWTGHLVEPSIGLLLTFALWSVLAGTGTTLATLFNAALVVRFQVVLASVMAACNLALSIWFVRHWHSAGGALWGSIVAYAVVIIVPYSWYYRFRLPHHFEQMSSERLW